MTNFDKIRITDTRRGEVTVEIKSFDKRQPGVEKLPHTEPQKCGTLASDGKSNYEKRIDQLDRMFGLGKFGRNLAEEILTEIYESGFSDGLTAGWTETDLEDINDWSE